MAVSLTTITGPVYLPNGATPVGGRVSFELSSWDQEEGEALIISGPVYSTIDENGQFSVELYTSTAGINSVHYRMFVIWEDSVLSESYVNNIYVGTPSPHYTKKYIGSFSLSGPGPFQVSDLTIISETNNSSFDAYLEMKAFVDRIDLGVLDETVAAISEDRAVVTSLAVQVDLDAEQVVADRVVVTAARDEVLAASQTLRSHFVTVGGQTLYPAGIGGVPAAISENGHILFGASPFGPLTYGIDYLVVDGGIQFTSDPGDGGLYHLITMPRFTNSEAQVILQDYKDRMVGRHPLDFGAVLDGVVDDTDAIRALHDWCNLNGVPPSYRGVEVFAVQADAEIQVHTSVDFCGAKIKAIGGIVGVPSYATLSNMFVISDPATPVQSGTVAVTDANLARGSKTPTADFWTQPGYVYMAGADLLTSPLIVNRQTDTPLTYRQSFKVIKAGVVAYHLERSMVGAGTVYYRARANSAGGWLEIGNFVIDASTINNSIVFQIERNQVQVRNWSVAFTGTLPPSINSMVFPKECCDVIIKNVTAPAMTSYGGNNGTYIVQTDYCAEITLDNVQAVNGWGTVGTNLTSGMYFRNCRLNRADAHFMCFNFFVENCVISEHGVVFGCGGGAMSIRNSRFIDCAVLSSRQDYGGYWFGDCVISDVTIERNNSATVGVVDMETNPVGFTTAGVTSLPLFDTIRISDIHRVGYTGTAYLSAVRIKVKSGGEGKMVAPASINIDGISGAATVGWSFFNTIDLLNMTQTARVDVNMSNIHPSRAMSLSNFDSGLHLLRMWPKVGAHATPDLNVTLNNVSQPAVDLSIHTGAPRLELHACKSIRRAVGGTGGRCVITGGTLDAPTLSGAETKGQIGNPGASGTYNIVALIGAEVAGAWDFSRCNHMAANVWTASQDSSMVFPAGVTWAIQAAGWRA